MGHFSNGTEGLNYQERYCWHCVHWTDDYGCPVWFLHELHVGEKRWAATLNKLIPIKDKVFNGQCYTFRKVEHEGAKEPPLRPGQVAALREWEARRAPGAAVADATHPEAKLSKSGGG